VSQVTQVTQRRRLHLRASRRRRCDTLRVMRSAALAAILLAACSGSSKPDRTTPPTPGDSTAEHPIAPPGDREPPTGAPVDATPDTPSGAAAARDAELATLASGLLEAFGNSEPVLTRDKRVVFVSNRDGLPQLYIADAKKPASTATRLVTSTERVTGVVRTPDGKAVIFQSDTGADENWSFYRVGLDGKGLIELTPGAKLNRDGVAIPAGKPDTMFFTARAMSEARSTVYSASAVAPGEATAVWTDEKPAYLADVSRDAKRVLVLRYLSQSENYLVSVDVKTGTATQLYPKDATNVTISAARFAPDGRRLYVATDGGAEQALVLALDVKTGEVLAKHELAPASAMVNALSVPDKGGMVAVSLLVGNHSEIRFLDGNKLTAKGAVDMPLGTGAALEFSEDGKQLAAQWSTPTTPSDLFVIDTKTRKVSALREEARPSLASLPGIYVTIEDIPAFDGGAIPTNVYVAADQARAKHPVIVRYHGGPAGTAVISWSAITAFFVSLGYVVVEPNVRGSSGFGRAFEAADNGAKRLDAFKDVETSARWAAKQPWADPDRMVVFGSSYGGYTVLNALARWPDIWRAGVDLVGIVNLDSFMKSTAGTVRETFLVEFGDPAKDAEFFREISPITHVDKIVDPTFVSAGANDPRVPRTESDQIVVALRKRGVATEYLVAANEGHSLSRRENQLAVYSRVARFLETHLE
jgi:dipeptidyl aminopeptidase/acylaminoacyl peptidase